jgi:hypothetical protein
MHEAIPEYWTVKLDEIEASLSDLSGWTVEEICRSAGGRPVWACARGPKKNPRRTANFSSAYHAGHPEAFWGEDALPPCFFYVTGVHGAEMEGPMAAVNFMHVVEQGCDLDGADWGSLRQAAQRMRLVVVPVLNPDGRARVAIPSLVGRTLADLRYWGQGRWKSGEDVGYPDCKRHQPLPLERVQFPGGYPNDEGYNLMHDVTPGDVRTAEVRALIRLALEEVPECVLNSHSYELSPGVLASSTVLEGYRGRQRELSTAVEAALEARGLQPRPYWDEPGYNLLGALHFCCGALAVNFEGPHGLASNPYTHRQILDCHLTAIEATLHFGTENGFRPASGA